MPPLSGATWLALADAAAFAVLGAVHVYWAAGGKWGSAVAFPDDWRLPRSMEGERQRTREPTPLVTLAVAFALFAAALVMLGRVGWLPFLASQPQSIFPQRLFTIGAWVLAVLFIARAIGDFRMLGFFKSGRGSRFAWWDTRLFSPLCFGIGLAAGIVALTAP